MSKLRMPVTEKDHVIGVRDAPATLVEYGDYQCSHCGFAHPLIKQLIQHFNTRLLFVFRNFPLQQSHPAAKIAAQAAEAAGLQDQFWEMHDMIYEHQEGLDENNIRSFAERINLDIEKFMRDTESERVLSKIESDFEGGIRSGVNGTPTFFINGNRLNSYDESYESLAAAVRKAAEAGFSER